MLFAYHKSFLIVHCYSDNYMNATQGQQSNPGRYKVI